MSAQAAPPPGKPAKLFLSYARADRARVKPIAQALAAAGHHLWWDALMEGGSAFAQEIETQLAAADVVIVMWSAASVGSDWVRDEAAHGRDRQRLVPVMLDGTAPPLGFRQYHAVDLSRWSGRAQAPEMAALLRAISVVSAAADPGDPAPIITARPAPPDGPAMSRRTALIAGGGTAAALVAGGLLALRPWQSRATRNSVAVLPFTNLSGDPAQAYFSDGLSEEVRSALARNPRLKVAAPTSSNTFRAPSLDVRQIAAQLGVSYMLEGSVRKSGQVVRVAAVLIDASTGFTSWSQSFDRRLDDIFAVQSEIANTVANALIVQVGGSAPAPGTTRSVAAYDALLRGRALFNADDGEVSDRAALAKFDEAIARDPHYAAAFAARSRSLAAIANQYAKAAELRALYQKAIAAAAQAVEIAPDLASAHAALGFATFVGLLDFKAPRASYDKARALGGGDADILVLFAFFASKSGRAAEALAAIREAQGLDRLNPRTFRAEGSIQNEARNYAAAIAPCEKALAMNPKLSTAHATIGTAQYLLGNVAAARASFEREPNAFQRLAGRAICAHRLGDTATAQAAMGGLLAVGDSVAFQQAQVRAQWGQTDAAIAALELAHRVSDSGITGILNDAMLDPVRKDSRFAALLSTLGLT